MVTQAQFNADQWQKREIVTTEVRWLGAELCRRTNRPAVAFGCKGDKAHLNGAHRSQEFIEKSALCTNRTYTKQSGLTADQKRHCAGVDFNPGSTAAMIAQCKRLIAAMKAGLLDGVLAIYGNVNGDQVVDGWDNVLNRAATSDSSHLWHWHLTLDRRYCADRALMERILAIALGDTLEEDDMSAQAEEQIKQVYNATFAGGGSMGRVVDPDGTGARPASNSIVAKLDYLARTADEQALRDAAILAAVRDDADRDAILARVDQRATEIRVQADQRAAAMRDGIVADLLARLPEQGPVSKAELIDAMNAVFGSLDGSTPTGG